MLKELKMILDEIINNTKQNIKIKKQKFPMQWLEETYQSVCKPRDKIIVAESGIYKKSQLKYLNELGVDAL
ncbi:hypothetical protein [Campylobacter pinnipediorum]|uniref:hypothetical protein n=1 Tax=Campylobacter pinnipediorum TaxID=1965231 RepID=UPI00084DAC43